MRTDNITFFDINDYFTPENKYGYVNLNNDYRILVSLDEESTNKLWGCELYDEDDGGINRQMICFSFHEDTFYYMEKVFFYVLNDRLGLFINMYEEEFINTDQLDEAISIVKNILNDNDDRAVTVFGQKLLEMMQTAKDHGTIMGFCF